jgi:hypothetical protein
MHTPYPYPSTTRHVENYFRYKKAQRPWVVVPFHTLHNAQEYLLTPSIEYYF